MSPLCGDKVAGGGGIGVGALARRWKMKAGNEHSKNNRESFIHKSARMLTRNRDEALEIKQTKTTKLRHPESKCGDNLAEPVQMKCIGDVRILGRAFQAPNAPFNSTTNSVYSSKEAAPSSVMGYLRRAIFCEIVGIWCVGTRHKLSRQSSRGIT